MTGDVSVTIRSMHLLYLKYNHVGRPYRSERHRCVTRLVILSWLILLILAIFTVLTL